MMQAEYKKRFRNAIAEVAAFVETKNTPGSGMRWAKKVIVQIERIASLNIEYPICNHSSLARYEYRCFHIGEWVIAYRIAGNKFIIYRFIHGSRLK